MQPPPAEKPGFIYEFGRWWDTTRGKFEELGKQSDAAAKDAATATQGAVQSAAQATRGAADATEDAMKSAAEATKNAATTLFRLPGIRVVEVRQRCNVAPNGAPDCRTAATNCLPDQGLHQRAARGCALVAELPARGLAVRPKSGRGRMSGGDGRPHGRLSVI